MNSLTMDDAARKEAGYDRCGKALPLVREMVDEVRRIERALEQGDIADAADRAECLSTMGEVIWIAVDDKAPAYVSADARWIWEVEHA